MQKNVEINERDFFKDTFKKEEIEALLRGKSASDMINFRSPSFKKMGLDKDTIGNEELIDLMVKEPRLVSRPVVRIGDEVHFGANKAKLESLLE